VHYDLREFLIIFIFIIQLQLLSFFLSTQKNAYRGIP
jgi:hypothetical protein